MNQMIMPDFPATQLCVAKPKSHWLDGVLVLQRPLQDSRIRAAQSYTKRLFGNQFRVTKLDQLDDEFANWVREAYQVGEGQHLVMQIRPLAKVSNL